MRDSGWNDVLNSEVMTNYLTAELKKESQKKEPVLKPVDKNQVVEDFISFENKVNKDPKLFYIFSQLQRKFASDIEYVNKCNPLFVQAVMMLDLKEQE